MEKPLLSDGVVEWVQYSRLDEIYSQFKPKDWNKILFGVGSDTGLANFIEDQTVGCYILKNCNLNTAIAFIYILPEGHKGVSLHGGSWKRQPLLLFRGYILMIEYLLCQGIKVKTYCSSNNEQALRFNHGVGFVRYRQTINRTYMWINLKRLHSSLAYRLFRR